MAGFSKLINSYQNEMTIRWRASQATRIKKIDKLFNFSAFSWQDNNDDDDDDEINKK